MTTQTFRNLQAKQPFEPFRLIMSSGEAYEVKHPEMMWVTKSDILIGVTTEADNVPSDYRICSMLHVTAIEPLPVSQGG